MVSSRIDNCGGESCLVRANLAKIVVWQRGIYEACNWPTHY